jgi:hypothetical protein
MSWSARTVGNVQRKLAISRALLLQFDKAQEDWHLTPQEDWLRKDVKHSYLGLASLERTIARQHAWIAALKEGDGNTSFFRQQCSYRRAPAEKQSVRLAADDRVLTDHYDGLLGTKKSHDCTLNFDELGTKKSHDCTLNFDELGTKKSHDCTLNFDELIEPDNSLQSHKIARRKSAGCQRPPACKAPGSDGYTAEFLWGTVKKDITGGFQQLYELRGLGFARLNQTLLTLLPKNAGATMLWDYQPISLIHLVAKLFAKVLSLRLAPKLASLVSPIQIHRREQPPRQFRSGAPVRSPAASTGKPSCPAQAGPGSRL